jgi:hypothetical protein
MGVGSSVIVGSFYALESGSGQWLWKRCSAGTRVVTVESGLSWPTVMGLLTETFDLSTVPGRHLGYLGGITGVGVQRSVFVPSPSCPCVL